MTDPDPAAAFAELLGFREPVAEVEAVSVARLPAPNPAQGTSGLPVYVDPVAAHEQAVTAWTDAVRLLVQQPPNGMWFDPITRQPVIERTRSY